MNPVVFYKNLADETRLKSLLLVVSEGELCVCELTCALGISQPKISRNLAQLRESGLLKGRRQGKWVYYRICPDLPLWCQNVLEETAVRNKGFIAGNLEQLNKMGERPARVASCC